MVPFPIYGLRSLTRDRWFFPPGTFESKKNIATRCRIPDAVSCYSAAHETDLAPALVDLVRVHVTPSD